MENEKHLTVIPGGALAPVDDDDAQEFEALIRDIAELRDPDTEIQHMDIAAYRKGKRS